MSEFSESYHIEAQDQTVGVNALAGARLRGWVFDPSNGWVTLIPRGHEFGTPVPSLIESSEGVLLHYLNAEDHGWMFALYSNGVPMTDYQCRWFEEESWTEELEIDDANLDVGLVVRIAARHGMPKEQAEAELRPLLYPPSQEWLLEYFQSHELENVGHGFARLMGLEHFRWLSPHYLELDEQRGPTVTNVIKVG